MLLFRLLEDVLSEVDKAKEQKKGFYEKYIKVPQDVFLASVALIVISPILLIVAILVRVKLGSPVIFKQDRAGKNGKPYYMYKFRSMADLRDENGELLPDEQRLGKFGKLLRSTSRDEFPSLWNVIRREVGIVGREVFTFVTTVGTMSNRCAD